MRRFLSLSTVAVLTIALLAACGSDGGGSGDPERFCELNDAVEFPPSDEELDQLVAAAPSEIKDQARMLADSFRTENTDTTDPELQAADEAVSSYVDENCDGPDYVGGD